MLKVEGPVKADRSITKREHLKTSDAAKTPVTNNRTRNDTKLEIKKAEWRLDTR